MSDSSVVIDCPEPQIPAPVTLPPDTSAVPTPTPVTLPPDASAMPTGPVPPEAAALFDALQRGFGPGADEPTRAAAYDACQRIAMALGVTPAAPAPPPAPAPMPASTVTSPVATLVQALRKLPREQLLDLAIARLRAALPTGVSVAAPDPVQFQLVRVMPASGGQ